MTKNLFRAMMEDYLERYQNAKTQTDELIEAFCAYGYVCGVVDTVPEEERKDYIAIWETEYNEKFGF